MAKNPKLLFEGGEPFGCYKNSYGNSYEMRIRGRKEIFPYALFEALKVRDHRLEPVPHNSFL